MKHITPRALGLFGRTYGMMLLTVFVAEGLIFILLIGTTSAIAPAVPFDAIVNELVSGERDERIQVNSRVTSQPVFLSSESEEARILAMAIQRELKTSNNVRVRLPGIGPPSVFGIQTEEAVAAGQRPILIAGDFMISLQLGNSRWRTITTDGRVFRAFKVRLALLLSATLVVIAPFAYLMASKATEPIRRFADAADRLGRDPHTAPLSLHGPSELRMAGEAFNRMQSRLTAYVEERTTMIAAVAHDIRTPLMRIAFLVEDAPVDLRKRIEQQVSEMRRLIDAVLRFLREEATRHVRERVDLHSIIYSAALDAIDAGHIVEMTGAEDAIIVDGDPAGLRSVFANLIGNAVTYGVKAKITIIRSTIDVVVEVCDEGPGIPEDDLERVFEAFVRVEKSRNRETGGVGLGLAITKSVVVAHGGSVSLLNRKPNGLCAIVKLPINQTGT